MERQSTIQKWIDAIVIDDLENVARESKVLKSWDMNTTLNKLIFRAALNLSHTADRAKPSDVRIGRLIFKITNNLCGSLTEVPDLIKFYCGLYHIIRKLIAMKLYSEAMEVTVLLFPSRLVRGLNSKHFDMYPKIAHLWHDAGVELADALVHGFDQTKYNLVLELLKNELRVLEIVAKDRSALVLCKRLSYLIKLDGIQVDLRLKGNQNHRNVAKDFLDRIEVCLGGEERYDVYRDALRFLNSATIFVKESSEKALLVFMEAYDMLEAVFAKDTELSSSLLIYKNMGMLIFKTPQWNIEKLRKEILNVVRNFRKGKAVLWNMRMVGHVLQPLFDRWENSLNFGSLEFLSTASLQEILSLIKLMFFVLNSIQTEGCEVCKNNDCSMKKYVHTVTIVSIKCLVVLAKQSSPNLLIDVFTPVKELLEDNVAAVFEMKRSNCSMWATLWSNCGINIYNLSATLHKTFYEETVFLFSLLSSCIVKFEGMNSEDSKINIKNSLPYVLHRLSSVHFYKGNYREALTPCALSGLLSYQHLDSKAFRMWANIKSACPDSKSILEMTMVSCLKRDMEFISEIGDVNLADYNLRELCLRELRGLHDARSNLYVAMGAVLDELYDLQSTTLQYAQGVQLLGYHLLHYKYDENFSKCLKRAKRWLNEEERQSNLHLLAAASLDFYTFVIRLRKAADQTKAEMETAKFAVRAKKPVDHDGPTKNNDCVVPAYSKINITEDSKLFAKLQKALDKWSVCVNKNVCVPDDWQSLLTLRILVIVGEYSRLHRFTTLENQTWDLAYKLARQLNDSRTCIYVVGRSMLTRSVNNEWVNTGNELMTELKNASDTETATAVSFFRVGLSNLYFDVGKHKEAVELLKGILVLPRTHLINNATTYLSSMVTVLRNYRLCSNDNDGTNYMVFLVRCLYSMAALIEYTPQPRVGIKEKELHRSEVLLTSTTYISLQMNSLLSFREISTHLMNRLKLSQASGVTLRVADCLKNLCFIDLSHMQLDNCTVKLQGLEFILQTEYIEESRNTKNPGAFTTEKGHSDASPILRKTVFKVPDFIQHDNCNCYKCSSVDYQYLVVSSIHIRAQLYFLQGNHGEALQHFQGAFLLRIKMLEVEKTRTTSKRTNNEIQYPWNCYYRAVEFVLLLIDFSRCIRALGSSEDRNGMDIAKEAVDFCERFHLQGHPIYFTARELLLEYQFYRAFPNPESFSKFTVPDQSSIDISRLVNLEENVNPSNITTPAAKPIVKKPRTMRRYKTPPLLKLTKVSMDLSDDEDDEKEKERERLGGSPKSSRQRIKGFRNSRVSKSAPRKRLESYLEADNEETTEVKIEEPEISDRKIIKEVMKTTSSFFPHLEKELNAILEDPRWRDSEKIELMMKLVKQQETNSESETDSLDSRRRGKNKDSESRLSNRNTDEAVDRVINSFNAILIESKGLPKRIVEDASASEGFTLLPSLSVNSFTSGIESERKKRQESSKLQQKEKIRTSERIKRSKSQSAEGKPKSSTRMRMKSLEDEDDVKSRGSRRLEKAKSEMVDVERKLDDSSSEAEDRAIEDKRKKGRGHKYRARTTSRVLRSRSPTVEDIVNDSDIIPCSDHEEQENALSKKLKALSMMKKSVLTLPGDQEAQAKRQTTKRATRARK